MRARVRHIKQSGLWALLLLNCAFPFGWERCSALFHVSEARSGMVTAIHEALCSLIAGTLITNYLQRNQGKRWFLLLAVSLFAVAIGDLNYGLTSYVFPVPPPRGYRPLVHEIPYVIFMTSLALSAVLRSVERTSLRFKFAIGALISVLALSYFVCSYHLIFIPFFNDHVQRPMAIYTTATIYGLSQSVAVGALIVASLRTLGWSEFLLWFMFLTLNASDFVLRYQDIGKTQVGVPFSEYGWEFALAVVCSIFVLLRARKSSFETYAKSPAPLFSLRVITAGISLSVLLAFVIITWSLSRYLGIVSAGNVGGYVLAFVAIWSISNGFSILLSKSLRDLHERLLQQGAKIEETLPSMAWEVGQIFTFLNQRNRELQREKDTVLRITSDVAHNIRTPLQGLRVALPRLERNIKTECGCRDENHTAIENLKESMRALEVTAAGLLAERKKILHMETIQSSTEGAVNIVGLSFPKKAIAFENKTSPTVFRVPGLTPVLLNLISNAAEASPEEKPVKVALRKQKSGYTIEIHDHGNGMEPGVLEAIERGEAVTTKPDGNGIGVSSAVEWARENGYGLTFRSSKDAGTVVTLSIPG